MGQFVIDVTVDSGYWYRVPGICKQSRCSFSKIEFAIAVQRKGAELLMSLAMKCSTYCK